MLSLTSTAFADGSPIPRRHLGPGHGQDVQPALAWTGRPDQTAAWALTLTDDDAPGYEHWLVVLPGGVDGLAEGRLPSGAVVGRGSRSLGYEGPCPPSGTHHYVFTLFALTVDPGLGEGFGRDEFDAATAGLVIDRAQLCGTYRPGLRHKVERRLRR